MTDPLSERLPLNRPPRLVRLSLLPVRWEVQCAGKSHQGATASDCPVPGPPPTHAARFPLGPTTAFTRPRRDGRRTRSECNPWPV